MGQYMKFVVTGEVHFDQHVIGQEEFTFEFPVREMGDLSPEQMGVTNISETQTLLSDLAKQVALSATWKSAAFLNDLIAKEAEEKAKLEADQG